MTASIKYSLELTSVFQRIGLVRGSNFVEAWIKIMHSSCDFTFRLGMRQLIFNALNKIEGVLTILVFAKMGIFSLKIIFNLISFMLWIIQTTWFLSVQYAGVAHYIQELELTSSYLHFIM